MNASEMFFSYLLKFGIEVLWGIILGLLLGLVAIYAYFKDRGGKKKRVMA